MVGTCKTLIHRFDSDPHLQTASSKTVLTSSCSIGYVRSVGRSRSCAALREIRATRGAMWQKCGKRGGAR